MEAWPCSVTGIPGFKKKYIWHFQVNTLVFLFSQPEIVQKWKQEQSDWKMADSVQNTVEWWAVPLGQMRDVSVSLSSAPRVAQYLQKIDAKNMVLTPAFALQMTVKHGVTINKSFRGELHYFKRFVSEKKPGFQKLWWSGFIALVFVWLGSGWWWACMMGKKHNQRFRNVYPWRASQRSFSSLTSFLNTFCGRAPGRRSSGRNWDTGGNFSLRFSHLFHLDFPSYLQPPPPSNSIHRHKVTRIFVGEGVSADNRLDITGMRIYFPYWWTRSHFFLVVTEQIEPWFIIYITDCMYFQNFYQISDSCESFSPSGKIKEHIPPASAQLQHLWVYRIHIVFQQQRWNKRLGPRRSNFCLGCHVSNPKRRQLLCVCEIQSASPQTLSQLWALYLLPCSFFLILKKLPPFTPFCSSPNGQCPLHEVLNKVRLYHLNCLLQSFWTVVISCLTFYWWKFRLLDPKDYKAYGAWESQGRDKIIPGHLHF